MPPEGHGLTPKQTSHVKYTYGPNCLKFYAEPYAQIYEDARPLLGADGDGKGQGYDDGWKGQNKGRKGYDDGKNYGDGTGYGDGKSHHEWP